jgi:undecaprenyl-diphosphatase
VQPQLENAAPESTMPTPRFFFYAALFAGFFFAVWSWLLFGIVEIKAFDEDCARFWAENARVQRWGFMVFFTDLGGVAAMALLTVVAALWQATHKNRLLALAWIGIAIGGALLNSGLKHAFNRDRPNIPDKAVLETNNSYPSGHAMGSAIGYGMLVYTLCLWQRCRWRRLLILVATACIVLAIGFSRMYLRAHWFSDVIGGWSIGLTWLFFCLAWLEHWRCRRV